MKKINMKCVFCGRVFPAGRDYHCPVCDGILQVEYETDTKNIEMPLSKSYSLIPVDRSDVAGIGSSVTPLVASVRIGETIGLNHLYFKCEQNNASGSFKDRPVSIAVAMAKQLGYKKVIAASSGNAAAATAACAARYGLECIILVPSSTPIEKVAQTVFYGAKIYKVDGPYSNCYKVAADVARSIDACNVTTTFLNPYSVEGDKVVGYEIYEQLNIIPDYVYVPVGAGPLLVGIGRGLNEYADIKGHDTRTKLIAAQAEGNSPIEKAFREGKETVDHELSPHTVAGGIADGLVGYEQDGTYTLRICRESAGAVRAVNDEQILDAQSNLARMEGLFVEPSSAAAVAAVIQDAKAGRIQENDVVVAVLTGHGLKDMKTISKAVEAPVISSAQDIA